MMASLPAPLNLIDRAHQTYRDGRYEEALGFYTEALRIAKTKPQKIALHSNRAACYLKLQDFQKAAEECTSVLELDQKHTGALMLRAQTLVTLKEYHSALFDVHRLMELNPSSEVYRNLHSRLKTQLSLAPIPEAETEEEQEEESERDDDENLEQNKVEADYEEKHLIHVSEEQEQEQEQERREIEGDQEKHIIDKADDIEEENSKGWQAIPQPKGHSRLDYSRWDSVEESSTDDDSDDDDDDDEEAQPRYRFRVRTVGVRSVK